MSALHAGYFTFSQKETLSPPSRSSSESSSENVQVPAKQTKDLRAFLGITADLALPGGVVRVHKKQSRFHRFKKFVKHYYRKFGLRNLTPFIIITLYSCFGAGIFILLERPNDIADRLETSARLNASRLQVVRRVEEIYIDPAFHNNQAKRDAEMFRVIDWYEQVIGFSFKQETSWTFLNAMYYCGTLYTTIGYGNMWPQTTGGRVFTIFYAIVGIPTVLSSLSSLGRLLFVSISRAVSLFDENISRRWRRFRKRPRIRQTSTGSTITHHSGGDECPVKLEEGVLKDVKEQVAEKVEGVEGVEEVKVDEVRVLKVPVSVALAVTIGWIFLCAALFCLWETNWSYFTSIYFIFISLSTIGLGDVTPDYPEYMIAVFYLVIIGLSLVSMLINVIQHRLKEVFMQVLVRVVTEYQKKIQFGQDKVGATQDMMELWNNDTAAKFLMPLLSNSAKQTVVQQFQDEAKAHGIDVPSVLQDIDPQLGLPSIFKVAMDQAPLQEQEPKHLKQEIAKTIELADAHLHQREALGHHESATQTFEDPLEAVETLCSLLDASLHDAEVANLSISGCRDFRRLKDRIEGIKRPETISNECQTVFHDPEQALETFCEMLESSMNEAASVDKIAVGKCSVMQKLKEQISKLKPSPIPETSESCSQTFEDPMQAIETLCSLLNTSLVSAANEDPILIGQSSVLKSLKQKITSLTDREGNTTESSTQSLDEPMASIESIGAMLDASLMNASVDDCAMLRGSQAIRRLQRKLEELGGYGENTCEAGTQSFDDPFQAIETFADLLQTSLTEATEVDADKICQCDFLKRLKRKLDSVDTLVFRNKRDQSTQSVDDPIQAVETLCRFLQTSENEGILLANQWEPASVQLLKSVKQKVHQLNQLVSSNRDSEVQTIEDPSQVFETFCKQLETSITESGRDAFDACLQAQSLRKVRNKITQKMAQLGKSKDAETQSFTEPLQAMETFCQLLDSTLIEASKADAQKVCKSEVLKHLKQIITSAVLALQNAETQTHDDPFLMIETFADILQSSLSSVAEVDKTKLAQFAKLKDVRNQLGEIARQSNSFREASTQSIEDPVQALENLCEYWEKSIIQGGDIPVVNQSVAENIRTKLRKFHKIAAQTTDVASQTLTDPMQTAEVVCQLMDLSLAASSSEATPENAQKAEALRYLKRKVETLSKDARLGREAGVQTFQDPVQAIESYCDLLQNCLSEAATGSSTDARHAEVLRRFKQKIDKIKSEAVPGIDIQTQSITGHAAVDSFCHLLTSSLNDTAESDQQKLMNSSPIRNLWRSLNNLMTSQKNVSLQATPTMSSMAAQSMDEPLQAMETLCDLLETSLMGATSAQPMTSSEAGILKNIRRKINKLNAVASNTKDVAVQSFDEPGLALETLCQLLETTLPQIGSTEDSPSMKSEFLLRLEKKIKAVRTKHKDAATLATVTRKEIGTLTTFETPMKALESVCGLLEASLAEAVKVDMVKVGQSEVLKRLRQKIAERSQDRRDVELQCGSSDFKRNDRACQTDRLKCSDVALQCGNLFHKTDQPCQTDKLTLCEMAVQTTVSAQSCKKANVQTELSMFSVDEKVTQTPVSVTRYQGIQTDRSEYREQAAMTDGAELVHNFTQTRTFSTRPANVQTDVPDLISKSSLTESLDFAGKLTQTYFEDREDFINDEEMQTDVVETACFGMQYSRDNSMDPEVGSLESRKPSLSSYESSESIHSLNWDPVHGLHAEKQKPVSRLKRLFDSVSGQGSSSDAPAKGRSKRFYSMVPSPSPTPSSDP